ncbi:shikimate dehydrogenase [Clostridium sp. A1-XYC3]|uniref:Shikimate dehydrogenase (NADP(+)) n=1 Tax=Clostridium tanneri TaxID=3037988 RepID=A0ABU4JQJ9_9CLOT|nr:shikimate dehydrogenase [Clostridium sp. A1-XYC3]MDW8800432.1 shikimate dehydrogenase [Clostridium sp. A1-XYC3]
MSNFYGLIGEKLGHSFSPQINKLILEKMKLKGEYNLFEIKKENLQKALEGLKALEAKGVNVTIPYKIEIIKYLDKLSKEAEKIGAVNTISFSNGILTGYNTDYHGFGASLKNGQIDICNKDAVILGTGGASKAVVQYLIDNGIKDIIYISRDPKNGLKKIKDFKIMSYKDMDNLGAKDIIINCTPCGMYPEVECCPVNQESLSRFSVAVDLIYNPDQTIFLKKSEELGLKTVNGLYMLVAQAVAAQEIWQGVAIAEETTEEIYKEIRSKF